MRIGVDAMGGDLAPAEQVAGALEARSLIGDDDRILLFGRAEEITPHLAEAADWADRIDVVNCRDVVGMSEAPVEALRTKPDSSIAVMARMHKARELDAIISAGNTGAYVAACQMYLRRLKGVHRPGIAIIVPTFHGRVVLCDVGANVNCRPQHLVQYGIMASTYLECVAGVQSPRVGLLSVGEEDTKGNVLTKQTHELFREHGSVKFIGNIEGRDLFRDVCDIAVCEGFVGNVCLKLMEGLAEGLFKSLKQSLAEAAHAGQGELVEKASEHLLPLLSRYDYNEYGGAPLLGVNGICIICHGSSNGRAIFNAIRVAKEFATQGINELITLQLTQDSGNGE